ncbi:MAG: histidine phosphatase family protein [Magnetospirillum sp. WYHS-4]
MKILYLLRHAKSSWKDPALADFDRPVSGRGRRAAKAMGDYMENRGMHPATVLCSAAERTRQTLDLVHPVLGADVPVEVRRNLYLADPQAILTELAALPDSVPSVLVIAHNPGLHDLAVALAASGDKDLLEALSEKFPTAALAVLTSEASRWKDLAKGGLHLEDFVRPKALDKE